MQVCIPSLSVKSHRGWKVMGVTRKRPNRQALWEQNLDVITRPDRRQDCIDMVELEDSKYIDRDCAFNWSPEEKHSSSKLMKWKSAFEFSERLWNTHTYKAAGDISIMRKCSLNCQIRFTTLSYTNISNTKLDDTNTEAKGSLHYRLYYQNSILWKLSCS